MAGTGGGHILEQFTPVFEGAVAGHDGGAGLVAAHDALEEILAGVLGQLLLSRESRARPVFQLRPSHKHTGFLSAIPRRPTTIGLLSDQNVHIIFTNL